MYFKSKLGNNKPTLKKAFHIKSKSHNSKSIAIQYVIIVNTSTTSVKSTSVVPECIKNSLNS